MTWNNQPEPVLQKVERGQFFAPDYASNPDEFDVLPLEWTHICSARFGEARPTGFNGVTRWSGHSYRYDIFTRDRPHFTRQVALRWSNGAGSGWLITTDDEACGKSCLLLTIAANPNESQRWDACHFLWNVAIKSFLAGGRKEYNTLTKAFIEGRLKKRKRKGSYQIEILPASLTS